MRRTAVIALTVVAFAALAAAPAAPLPAAAAPAAAGDPVAEVEAWKQERDQRLRRPDGWLTLVGLWWLADGDNAVGSAADATVRLPAGKAPERVGTIRVRDGAAAFLRAPGVEVTLDGAAPAAVQPLADDAAESGPTVLRHGSLSFYLIERGGALAVRVKDGESEALRSFRGLEYFPYAAAWRLEGRFEAAPEGSALEVPNSVGRTEKIRQPGWVIFEAEGATHRLIALDDTGDGRLFLVFGDRTNGRETYGGGRFLYTDPPVDGKIVVDFNRAYSPPCVFTPYATCPLPPPENKLRFRIEAGEKNYAGAAH
jgi:uncharacterized protein (DUF1684 family)